MSKVTNVVLYSLDASYKRRPLISVAPDDVMGAAKLGHAATREFTRAEAQGVPHPELICVRETRDADEQGKATFAEYVRIDLAGREIGEAVQKLDGLFAAIIAVKMKADEDAARERAAALAAQKGSE